MYWNTMMFIVWRARHFSVSKISVKTCGSGLRPKGRGLEPVTYRAYLKREVAAMTRVYWDVVVGVAEVDTCGVQFRREGLSDSLHGVHSKLLYS